MSKYLLILSCSKTKKRLYNVNALDLYDGPFYKMIKKYDMTNIDVLIISAKYGLIKSTDRISYYNQIMTKEQANLLSKDISITFKHILNNNKYAEIFINLGKNYLISIENSKHLFNNNKIIFGEGEIGRKLHQQKEWINKINN